MQAQALRPGGYLLFFVAFASIVFLAHAPFLNLPYFWDELGQFVPSALDIYHDGEWVPHSAVPNAHPPGVMAYLAAVWKIFGYSIAATRVAMLVLASATVFSTFLLAIRLCPGFTAFAPVLLLLADPLFYMQAMMAQLDMPAMLFTVLALLLFFEDRHVLAAAACTALVLAKETGALLPLIFAVVLFFDRPRAKYAAYYAVPFVALAIWFFVLWRSTGQLFGDAGFTHYNLGYAMHPVRAGICLVRRVYYLFIDDFRFVGSLAILFAWKRTQIFAGRAWRITGLFFASHVVLVSVLGGAELERYLLPVLPILYIAMAAALPRHWLPVAVVGLLVGLFMNPPYPFPFENNLAMVDFVDLHRDAASYLEAGYPEKTVYTAWPLTGSLRDPAFGYVKKKLATFETSDFRYSTLAQLDPQGVEVLVLYSRTWDPGWSVLRWPMIERFLHNFYEYEPQMNADQVQECFGLKKVRRWERRNQWIEIYGR